MGNLALFLGLPHGFGHEPKLISHPGIEANPAGPSKVHRRQARFRNGTSGPLPRCSSLAVTNFASQRSHGHVPLHPAAGKPRWRANGYADAGFMAANGSMVEDAAGAGRQECDTAPADGRNAGGSGITPVRWWCRHGRSGGPGLLHSSAAAPVVHTAGLTATRIAWRRCLQQRPRVTMNWPSSRTRGLQSRRRLPRSCGRDSRRSSP